MLYQPKRVDEMWDTWLYYHEGTHFLFYLHKTELSFPLWDGMSVAKSVDGVHYEEFGPILHKSSDAEWLGTGSTWQVGGRFVLNYSESRGGVQSIYFAESKDLFHWQPLGDAYRLNADPRWYDTSPTGRWDCIWTVEKRNGSWVGYLTAIPKRSSLGLSCESVGKVVSIDGIHWSADRPPEFAWGDQPPLNLGEVGAVEKIDDRWCMIIGMIENRFGTRNNWNQLGQQVGMYAFFADDPEGPFRPAKNTFRLLTSSHWATYFARFYRTPEELLLNHHSIERNISGPRVWMAPLKKVVLEEEEIKLAYWPGNDCLKGHPVPLSLEQSQVAFPLFESEGWKICPDRIEGTSENHGGMVILDAPFDFDQGIILEGRCQVKRSCPGWSSVGFYFEEERDQSGTAVLAQTRGITQAGKLTILPDGSIDFSAEDVAEKGITPGRMTSFRLLLRRTLLELYLDEFLVLCYSLPRQPTGRIGLVFETGQAIYEQLTAWQMSLPR